MHSKSGKSGEESIIMVWKKLLRRGAYAMTNQFPTLFSPCRIGNVEIKNRICKAPQTTGLSHWLFHAKGSGSELCSDPLIFLSDPAIRFWDPPVCFLPFMLGTVFPHIGAASFNPEGCVCVTVYNRFCPYSFAQTFHPVILAVLCTEDGRVLSGILSGSKPCHIQTN